MIKIKRSALICLMFLCGNTFAQINTNIEVNPDVLVVSGKIIDAVTKLPINVKINFDKFGEELLCGSIYDGNYTLELNKKELGETIFIAFKLVGFRRYFKKINKKYTHIVVDILLQPIKR